MDDFPWRWWCHNGKTDCKEKLRLKSFGTTSSLAELEVECDCGAKRRMSGSMQRKTLMDVTVQETIRKDPML